MKMSLWKRRAGALPPPKLSVLQQGQGRCLAPTSCRLFSKQITQITQIACHSSLRASASSAVNFKACKPALQFLTRNFCAKSADSSILQLPVAFALPAVYN